MLRWRKRGEALMLGPRGENRYPRLSAMLIVATLIYTVWQFGKLYWSAFSN